MARAETLTKLPLDRWAQIIGIHPAHFNGVYFGEHSLVCQQPWLQHSFQAADRVGREEIARAIAQAEADIESYLGYRLMPAWEVDEWRPTVRPWRKDLLNLGVTDIRGFGQIAFANWGFLVSGGIRGSNPIEENAAIAWSDLDGDGYKETATVGPITVDEGQDPCEIHIYYPVWLPLVEAGGMDKWEIRPISVSIVGTNATITFKREQTVLPDLVSDYFPPADDSHLRGVDGNVDGNFLEAVDVYRVYNDPQTQVTMMWEPFGSACSCNGNGCERCAYTAQAGCLMLRDDPRHSIVVYSPGTWNEDTHVFDAAIYALGREPDLVRLYYYAGLRNKSLGCPTAQMDPEWQRTMAYYTAALLDRPICECNNIKTWVDHWQRDLAIPGEVDGLRISAEQLNNPFGTRRGAVYAWNRVNREGAASGKAVFA